jgi:hypothetical protein
VVTPFLVSGIIFVVLVESDLGCRWVYNVNYIPDGSVEHLMVALGCCY